MTPETLIQHISALIGPQGYEVVHLELLNQRQKVLRLFIDLREAGRSVGIEDCATVSRLLDEPLEQDPELKALFGGAPFELEVSSPGVDRPLRTDRDYERFTGKLIRVQVFRPLTAEELANADYQSRNPKQKNFLGVLQGKVSGDRIQLALDPGTGPRPGVKKGQKVSKHKTAAPAAIVTIPLPLVSKACLEPVFEESEK